MPFEPQKPLQNKHQTSCCCLFRDLYLICILLPGSCPQYVIHPKNWNHEWSTSSVTHSQIKFLLRAWLGWSFLFDFSTPFFRCCHDDVVVVVLETQVSRNVNSNESFAWQQHTWRCLCNSVTLSVAAWLGEKQMWSVTLCAEHDSVKMV